MVVLPVKRSHGDVDSDEDHNADHNEADDPSVDGDNNDAGDANDDNSDIEEDRLNRGLRVWDRVVDEAGTFLDELRSLGYDFHDSWDHEYWDWMDWLFWKRRAYDERPSTT